MRFETRMAQAGYGEINVRGRSILGGTEHEHDVWSMLSIAVGHRPLTAEECRIFDILSNVLMIGDPRLWPYRAERLVASYGDPYLALAAANAFYSDGKLAAPAVGKAMRQYSQLADECGLDAPYDAVKAWVSERFERREIIAGYNVVARETDERNDFLEPLFEREGWYETPWFKLVRKLDRAIFELRGIRPNGASLYSAFSLHLGLSPLQGEMIGMAVPMWCNVGNAVEGVGAEYHALRRLPDEMVQWSGVAPRVSPRKSAADEAASSSHD